jgi:hypothetical protein
MNMPGLLQYLAEVPRGAVWFARSQPLGRAYHLDLNDDISFCSWQPTEVCSHVLASPLDGSLVEVFGTEVVDISTFVRISYLHKDDG